MCTDFGLKLETVLAILMIYTVQDWFISHINFLLFQI